MVIDNDCLCKALVSWNVESVIACFRVSDLGIVSLLAFACIDWMGSLMFFSFVCCALLAFFLCVNGFVLVGYYSG